MKRATKVAVGLAAAVALLATLTLGSCGDAGVGLWFAQSQLDRVNPFVKEATVWAAAPAADDHVDTYDDATGAYVNYVYELTGTEADGSEHPVYLISFGGEFDDAPAGTPLRLKVKGRWVRSYAVADASEVPAAAARALG